MPSDWADDFERCPRATWRRRRIERLLAKGCSFRKAEAVAWRECR